MDSGFIRYSCAQNFIYLRSSFSILQAYAAAGTVNQNYANILLMLLRLRQACDHPFLVKGYDSDFVGKDSAEMARKLPREMLINLLNLLETSLAICHVCNVSFLETLYHPSILLPAFPLMGCDSLMPDSLKPVKLITNVLFTSTDKHMI